MALPIRSIISRYSFIRSYSAAAAATEKLRWSYVSGSSTTPLLGETIGQNFDRNVELHPNNEALVVCHQNVRLSYTQLREKVDNFAAGLIGLGLEPGDRVGIWAQNCAEWVVTQFATAKAGLIQVNINPAYRPSELEYALNKVGCKALILAPSFHRSNYIHMLNQLAPELDTTAPGQLDAERIPSLKHVIRFGHDRSSGMFNFDEVSRMGGHHEHQLLNRLGNTLQFDDPINIQFTSGTTGHPKGATLTHHNILNNGYFCGQRLGYTPQDRVCVPVPLYHCFGMVVGTLSCVSHGSTMVLPSEGFHAGQLLDALQNERVTSLYGVPTMFIAALEHPDFAKYNFSTLRTGVMSGAVCPAPLCERVARDMHIPELCVIYGMTETAPVNYHALRTDPPEVRYGTVGKILPYTESKIVDTEGRIVPVGTPGEILFRGYNVMKGYWADEDKTKEAIDKSRWLHSGDIGVLDGEGNCRVVGRLKDLIIRGGENVYPRELEDFLHTHPAVEDVHVVGLPDPKFGEEVCAWVKLKEGVAVGESVNAEHVRAYCKDKIAHYKIPRYVKLVDSFPMTVTGKVQKFKIREIMIKELNLKD